MKKFRLIWAALLMITLAFVSCDKGNTEPSLTDAPTAAPTESETEPATEKNTEVTTDMPTEIPTEAPTEPATEAPTEPETATPDAGIDHGIVRDGTPKKYFTIRMDDGITQDARIMEILRKYNMDCCTFYINTGLLGANWAWVGQSFNRPDVTHLRYTRAELSEGIYNGFDVEVHTSTHPSLKNLADKQVTREVKNDAASIKKMFGYNPIGMAWPGGDTEWNDHNVDTIVETTDIRYGSCTTSTYNFQLPQYFMKWYPTCSTSDGRVMELAREFVEAEPTEDMLFYVWGHGYEFDIFHSWGNFEALVKLISEAAAEDDSMILVTNAEFYQLFKGEIPAWKD